MSAPTDPPSLPHMAPPIPVQPLHPTEPYDYNTYPRRPGIITAIAILSITIGSLGLLAGGASALYGALFYFIVRQTAAIQAMPAQQVFVPQTQLVPNQPDIDANGDPLVGERGLDTATRQIIIDQLGTQRPLTDARRRQLHALFAKTGKDAFPQSSGGAITSDDVRRAINESGQLPSPSDNDPNPGPDFFVIAAGRIEVSDDRALFEPADHSLETVRVSAPAPSTDTSNSSLPTPSAPLSQVPSAADARAASQIVMQQTSNRLNSQQLQRLFIEFTSNTGLLQSSSTGGPVSSQIITSSIQPDGSLFLMTTHGQLRLSSQGLVQSRLITPNAFGMFGPGTGGKAIAATPAILVVSEAIFSVLLSIYLLVIGILTLRQNARSRQLHVIYALLKIPLAILCGIGWSWLIGTFMAALPNNAGGSPVAAVRAFVLVFVSGVAILYPIGLLITFMTPSVKRYYDSGQHPSAP